MEIDSGRGIAPTDDKFLDGELSDGGTRIVILVLEHHTPYGLRLNSLRRILSDRRVFGRHNDQSFCFSIDWARLHRGLFLVPGSTVASKRLGAILYGVCPHPQNVYEAFREEKDTLLRDAFLRLSIGALCRAAQRIASHGATSDGEAHELLIKNDGATAEARLQNVVTASIDRSADRSPSEAVATMTELAQQMVLENLRRTAIPAVLADPRFLRLLTVIVKEVRKRLGDAFLRHRFGPMLTNVTSSILRSGEPRDGSPGNALQRSARANLRSTGRGFAGGLCDPDDFVRGLLGHFAKYFHRLKSDLKDGEPEASDAISAAILEFFTPIANGHSVAYSSFKGANALYALMKARNEGVTLAAKVLVLSKLDPRDLVTFEACKQFMASLETSQKIWRRSDTPREYILQSLQTTLVQLGAYFPLSVWFESTYQHRGDEHPRWNLTGKKALPTHPLLQRLFFDLALEMRRRHRHHEAYSLIKPFRSARVLASMDSALAARYLLSDDPSNCVFDDFPYVYRPQPQRRLSSAKPLIRMMARKAHIRRNWHTRMPKEIILRCLKPAMRHALARAHLRRAHLKEDYNIEFNYRANTPDQMTLVSYLPWSDDWKEWEAGDDELGEEIENDGKSESKKDGCPMYAFPYYKRAYNTSDMEVRKEVLRHAVNATTMAATFKDRRRALAELLLWISGMRKEIAHVLRCLFDALEEQSFIRPTAFLPEGLALGDRYFRPPSLSRPALVPEHFTSTSLEAIDKIFMNLSNGIDASWVRAARGFVMLKIPFVHKYTRKWRELLSDGADEGQMNIDRAFHDAFGSPGSGSAVSRDETEDVAMAGGESSIGEGPAHEKVMYFDGALRALGEQVFSRWDIFTGKDVTLEQIAFRSLDDSLLAAVSSAPLAFANRTAQFLMALVCESKATVARNSKLDIKSAAESSDDLTESDERKGSDEPKGSDDNQSSGGSLEEKIIEAEADEDQMKTQKRGQESFVAALAEGAGQRMSTKYARPPLHESVLSPLKSSLEIDAAVGKALTRKDFTKFLDHLLKVYSGSFEAKDACISRLITLSRRWLKHSSICNHALLYGVWGKSLEQFLASNIKGNCHVASLDPHGGASHCMASPWIASWDAAFEEFAVPLIQRNTRLLSPSTEYLCGRTILRNLLSFDIVREGHYWLGTEVGALMYARLPSADLSLLIQAFEAQETFVFKCEPVTQKVADFHHRGSQVSGHEFKAVIAGDRRGGKVGDVLAPCVGSFNFTSLVNRARRWRRRAGLPGWFSAPTSKPASKATREATRKPTPKATRKASVAVVDDDASSEDATVTFATAFAFADPSKDDSGSASIYRPCVYPVKCRDAGYPGKEHTIKLAILRHFLAVNDKGHDRTPTQGRDWRKLRRRLGRRGWGTPWDEWMEAAATDLQFSERMMVAMQGKLWTLENVATNDAAEGFKLWDFVAQCLLTFVGEGGLNADSFGAYSYDPTGKVQAQLRSNRTNASAEAKDNLLRERVYYLKHVLKVLTISALAWVQISSIGQRQRATSASPEEQRAPSSSGTPSSGTAGISIEMEFDSKDEALSRLVALYRSLSKVEAAVPTVLACLQNISKELIYRRKYPFFDGVRNTFALSLISSLCGSGDDAAVHTHLHTVTHTHCHTGSPTLACAHFVDEPAVLIAVGALGLISNPSKLVQVYRALADLTENEISALLFPDTREIRHDVGSYSSHALLKPPPYHVLYHLCDAMLEAADAARTKSGRTPSGEAPLPASQTSPNKKDKSLLLSLSVRSMLTRFVRGLKCFNFPKSHHIYQSALNDKLSKLSGSTLSGPIFTLPLTAEVVM